MYFHIMLKKTASTESPSKSIRFEKNMFKCYLFVPLIDALIERQTILKCEVAGNEK